MSGCTGLQNMVAVECLVDGFSDVKYSESVSDPRMSVNPAIDDVDCSQSCAFMH